MQETGFNFDTLEVILNIWKTLKPMEVQELDESKLKAAFTKLKKLPENENLFSVLVELRYNQCI